MGFEKPKKISYITLLNIGDLVEVNVPYTKLRYGKVIRIMKPGYIFKNTYPWVVRYEIQDLQDKSHTIIVPHYLTTKSINHKFKN